MSDGFYYLPSARMEGNVQVMVENAQGQIIKCTAAEEYSICNYMPLSLFRNVEVTCNNTEISDSSSSNAFPYKAYLEAILSFGSAAKSTHLLSSYWKSGKAGLEKTFKPATNAVDSAESGYIKRKDFCKLSKQMPFVSSLHLDLFSTQKLMIPGVSIKLRYHRTPDTFTIVADTGKTYHIKLTDLRLRVRKVIPSPGILSKTIEQLQSGKEAIYELNTTKCLTQIVPEGSSNYPNYHLFNGILPKQLLIGFIDPDSFNGHIKANPFVFGNHGINDFVFHVNSELVPATRFKPNFAEDLYVREFANLCECIGISGTNEDIGLTPEKFKNALTLFALDLSPDQCNSFHSHLPQTGTLGFEVTFSAPLQKSLIVFVYGVFSSALTFDKYLNAKLEHLS